MTTTEFLKYLDSKPSHGTKALKECLKNLEVGAEDIRNEIPENSPYQRIRVKTIKKYDVIKMKPFGSAHYILVFKVKDNIVYGVCITSKEKCWCITQIKEDRRYEGRYITNNVLCYPLEECLDNFISVYESKKEANIAIQLVRNHFKSIL